MEVAAERGQRQVVIDPRDTDTARAAWLHLKLKSQTDLRLWNGLLAFLWDTGDRAYIAGHTSGLREVLDMLARDDQSLLAVSHDLNARPPCGASARA